MKPVLLCASLPKNLHWLLTATGCLKAFVFFGYHIWQQSSGDVSISVWDSPETTASSYIQSDGSAPPYKPWESVVCYHARPINHYAYHPLQRNALPQFLLKKLATSFCYCREGHIINHITHLLYLPRATTDWKMRGIWSKVRLPFSCLGACKLAYCEKLNRIH